MTRFSQTVQFLLDEEVRSQCLLLHQLTRPFGFELTDEELIQQLEGCRRAQA